MDAAVRRELDELRSQVASLRRREMARRRGAGWRRRGAALIVALLVALVPLGLLAAGPFIDLNQGPDHAAANADIQAIADVGITRGCNPPDFTAYCPNDFVTREQMASFLARTAGLGGNSPVANAKTATNAAQLGGLPPASYAQVGGAAQFSSLAVNGTIGSPRFKVIQVVAGSPGPLPTASNTFNTGGGPLLVFVGGSAYRTGTGGLLGMNLELDGEVRGVVRTYANETVSHRAFPGGAQLLTGVPAGGHTLRLTPFSGTTTDASDFFSITVLELPFECSGGVACD